MCRRHLLRRVYKFTIVLNHHILPVRGNPNADYGNGRCRMAYRFLWQCLGLRAAYLGRWGEKGNGDWERKRLMESKNKWNTTDSFYLPLWGMGMFDNHTWFSIFHNHIWRAQSFWICNRTLSVLATISGPFLVFAKVLGMVFYLRRVLLSRGPRR